jgi:hypothetical protein
MSGSLKAKHEAPSVVIRILYTFVYIFVALAHAEDLKPCYPLLPPCWIGSSSTPNRPEGVPRILVVLVLVHYRPLPTML